MEKETGELSMKVQLSVGMSVMVTENVLTTASLTNGTRATISKIVVDPRKPAMKKKETDTIVSTVYLTFPSAYLVLDVDNNNTPLFEGLRHGEVPLMPVTHNFKVGSRTIKQRQLPVT